MARPKFKAFSFRILRWLSVFLLGLLQLVATVVIVVLLTLRLPQGAAFAAGRADAALADQFRGRLVIDDVRRIGLTGLEGARLRVLAPDGRELAKAGPIDIEIPVIDVVRSVLFDDGPIDLYVERIRIADCRVLLSQDPTGQLEIAQAFEARHPSPRTEEGRGLRLTIDRLSLRHAWIHGTLGTNWVDADLHDLGLGVVSDPASTVVSAANARVVARALPASSDADLAIGAELVAPKGGLLAVNADLDGSLAGAAVSIHARTFGESLTVDGLVEGLEPERIKALAPSVELGESVSARVHAMGSLKRLGLAAELAVGAARIDARGTLLTDPAIDLTLALGASGLDARAFSGVAPGVRADLDGSLWVALDRDRISSELVLGARSLSLDESKLPDVDLQAELARDPGQGLRGRALVSVPNGRSNYAKLDVSQAPGAPAYARVESRLVLDMLRGLPGVPPSLAGRFELEASGRFDPDARKLDARTSARLYGVRAANAAVQQARIAAAASGSLDDPALEVHAAIDEVKTGSLTLTGAKLDVKGRLSGLSFAALVRDREGRRLGAEGLVDARHRVLEHAKLELESRGIPLTATVERIAFGRKIAIKRVVIQGAGRVEVTGNVSPNETELRAVGTDVDLGKLATFAAIHQVGGGKLSFDGAVRMTKKDTSAKLVARATRVELARAGKVSANLDAQLENGRFDMSFDSDLDRAGTLRVIATEVRAPKRKDFESSFREATGQIDVGGRLDLAQLPPDIRERLPVVHTRGSVTLAVMARRMTADASPALAVHFETRGLSFTTARTSTVPVETRQQAKKLRPKHFEGIDLFGDLAFQSTKPEAKVEFRARDAKGTLLKASAEMPVTVYDVVGGELQKTIDRNLPVKASVKIPRRALEDLPDAIQPDGIEADVALEARLEGTVRDPRVDVEFHAYRLKAGYRTEKNPIDADVVLRHRAKKTELSVDAFRKKRHILETRVVAEGSAAELARGQGVITTGRAVLNRFPIGILPGVEERQVKGHATGEIELKNLGRLASLDASIALGDLRVGGLACQRTKARLAIGEDGKVTGRVSLDHDKGWARADLETRVEWGAAIVPKLVKDAATRARFRSHNLRAAAFLPFLHETFSELDGNIDSDMLLASQKGSTEITGHARIKDGVVQMPAVGQTYRDVRMRVEASKGGVIKVSDLSARGLSGRLRAAAAIRLNGLALSGARLKAAVDKSEKIPIALQGASLGHLWGGVEVDYTQTADGKSAKLAVKTDKLHVEISEKGGQKIQPLEDAPYVRVGVRAKDQLFRTLPLQPLEEETEEGEQKKLSVEIKLGKDVWIHRGNEVRIQLTGNLVMDVGKKTLARGQIKLKRGILDVQGKRFEIDQGTITFANDEPNNPQVVVTARWDSPDGYRVYADYRGRAQAGKLSLRADPSLTQDQILSLLLFGEPDGTLGGDGGGGNGAAVGMAAAGPASKGVNRALSDLTELDVQTRVDTSHGSARPEIVIQLSRRLAAELAYAPSEPAPGQPADRTFLTLDLRLGSRWSLDTTAGDKGATSVDLVWRHRY